MDNKKKFLELAKELLNEVNPVLIKEKGNDLVKLLSTVELTDGYTPQTRQQACDRLTSDIDEYIKYGDSLKDVLRTSVYFLTTEAIK
ncbi:hypothetical protein [Myroides marinus]|uniref:hypothetical protein n=1 Tax=Myroides marinus TaxID=703342 RepID=UPI0025767BE4|nr:hypothetical protein [Myroides marinus]MDM1378158.1 hypothetical protein [Myroides marinus]MDM1385456.1 hypothetical protein [Myroides marinus]MDM1392669.1 hypothetical protein [Myroides marinus]